MDWAAAATICLVGGMVGGLVGVGGGVLFVPALTIFFGIGQVEAESTSLLMIVLVAAAGSVRQYGYGNVRVREAVLVGVLSPIGVGIGVVVSNAVPEKALELGFAALALYMAWRLVVRTRSTAPSETPMAD
jgi:uncharacterized protein